MRRLVTLALALGLAALVAVAAVDALRDADESAPEAGPAPEPTGPTWLDGGPALVERLRSNGIRGTLYLSADGCLEGNVRRLRALRLPDLSLAEGPRSRTCAFTLSADGGYTAGEAAVWRPQDPVFAAPTGADELALIDAESSGQFEVAGTAPAFKPDGTLTHLQGGRVVEWTNECEDEEGSVSPPVALQPGETGGYCTRTLIDRDELVRSLPEDSRLESVHALVWADASRMLAVLETEEGPWLAPYENGRSLGYANGLSSRRTQPPRADPEGDYIALGSGGFLEVFDRNAGRAWGSSIQTVAFDWSPDGTWLAVAAPTRIHLVRTLDWTSRFTLPLSTEGLAWRQ
jgi:hypothetical protein